MSQIRLMEAAGSQPRIFQPASVYAKSSYVSAAPYVKWYAAIQGARVLLIISPSTLVFLHYWEQGTYELLSLHTADLIFTSQGVMILTKSAFICLRQLRNQALWALSFALMQPFSRPMKAMPFHLMFSQSIIRQGSTLPGRVILVLLTCEIAQAVGIRILSFSDQRHGGHLTTGT